MNTGAILAAMAGLAIAAQVVVNTLGIRTLGVGALIGVSGLLGAFILAAIVVAAGRAGLAQTLSLVIASQLLAGLLIDRKGLFGKAAADFGGLKVLGVVLVLVGGVLVVRG